jgi:predicted dehydrogenase
MSKLKAGIVGCGGIANQKHFPALSLLKDEVEIVYFLDQDCSSHAEFESIRISMKRFKQFTGIGW